MSASAEMWIGPDEPKVTSAQLWDQVEEKMWVEARSKSYSQVDIWVMSQMMSQIKEKISSDKS